MQSRQRPGLCTTAGQTYPPYAYGVREFFTIFGPYDLHTTAAFPAGGLTSTANHGTGNNTLDVFAKGTSNNTISFMRVVGVGSWSGPTAVTNTSGQLIDSSFAAAANRSTNLLDLIAIGSNGISISTSTSGGSYGTFTKLP